MRRQEESEECWIIEIPFFSFHDDLDFDFNEYYADIRIDDYEGDCKFINLLTLQTIFRF